jgi:hypothetical protein
MVYTGAMESTKSAKAGIIESITDAVSIVCDTDGALSDIYRPGEKLPEADGQYPFPFGLWFRGQSKVESLVPSVFRRPHGLEDNKDAYYDESMMIQHFRQRNSSY